MSYRSLLIMQAIAALHRANGHIDSGHPTVAKQSIATAIERIHDALDIAPSEAAIEEVRKEQVNG